MRFSRGGLRRGKDNGSHGENLPSDLGSRLRRTGHRMSAQQAAELQARFPTRRYNSVGRTFHIPRVNNSATETDGTGRVTIVTAGTSDMPVAEEARETALVDRRCGTLDSRRRRGRSASARGQSAAACGRRCRGGRGRHGRRFPASWRACRLSRDRRSHQRGLRRGIRRRCGVLGMLNSCAANVAVVNIDAGFKAGYVAGLIAKNAAKARTGKV